MKAVIPKMELSAVLKERKKKRGLLNYSNPLDLSP
jgi:hypothetical protein